MNPEELTAWRRARRKQLLAQREACDANTRTAWGRSISRSILSLPLLAGASLGIYWPIRSEYDPRFVAHELRQRGGVIGLPVVVGKGRPLIFREWHPGVAMLKGGLDIPYPAATSELVPDACLIPPVGFDTLGYRLGYGAGFFDRTLAALSPRPLAIGVAFECARMATIYPQPYDIALDFIVTEAGIYAVMQQGLELVDANDANRHATELAAARRLAHTAAAAAQPGGLSSPVCYAREVAPDYFGEDTKPGEPGKR
jgi:5-formyltetrahydrofolate cyclo-ligase